MKKEGEILALILLSKLWMKKRKNYVVRKRNFDAV